METHITDPQSSHGGEPTPSTDGGDDTQQPYDYNAYYQYYQQNPEAYMQYMQQWQQYQQQQQQQPQQQQQQHPQQSTGYDYSSYYQGYSQTDSSSSTSYGLGVTGGYGGDSGNRGPSNTLWIGSLPWECNEQDLRYTFQEFGQVDNVRMLPAKNCAFVTFTHIECAIAAHEQSYSIHVKGSPVKVGWGKSTPVSSLQRNQYEEMAPSRNIFIGSIDVTTSEDELRNFFIQFGPIERVKILPHKQCAFILYTHLDSASKARDAMNGQLFKGVTIKVNYGKQPEQLVQNQQNQQIHQHSSISTNPTDFSSLNTDTKPQPHHDDDIQNIIEKLAFFVSRSQNSDELEAFVKKRQENNPNFNFLTHGEEGNDYYRWKVKIEKAMKPRGDEEELPPWLQNTNQAKEFDIPESPFPNIEHPLTTPEKEELEDLLENLVGSKESIKYGRDWIFNHKKNALVVFKLIHDYAVSKTNDYSKQLSCLHLIFDVLHHSYHNLREEGKTMDEMSYSVKNHIPLMIKRTFRNAESEDERSKVLKLITKWQEKNVFDEQTMETIEQSVMS